MKSKKPDKVISNMDVLKDIRGLLSVSQERENVAANVASSDNSLNTEISGLKTQIKSYEEQIKKQQEELFRVEKEKKELTTKLMAQDSGKDKTTPAASKSVALGEEIGPLEERIAELSAELSKIDESLKIKTQELLRKIARIFEQAGQGEIAIEFRKGASGLEAAENFAHFLQVLLEQ